MSAETYQPEPGSINGDPCAVADPIPVGTLATVRKTGSRARIIWSDATWTVLLAEDEYPPWAQTINTSYVRERCDLAAPAPIAVILRREG